MAETSWANDLISEFLFLHLDIEVMPITSLMGFPVPLG